MRRRVIRWFRLAGLLDAAAAADMLAWLNSGFSIDASVRITLIDRDVPSYFQSLEHLLRYCAQSSHIATVGYELYCRLLEQAVRGMKSLPPAEPPPVNVDLPGEAWLPRDYIADFRAKIDVYRRLSRATAEQQIDELAAELGDRFGPLPVEARRLLEFTRLKTLAIGLGIDSITRHPGLVVIGHHDRAAMEKLRLAAGTRGGTVRIVDQKTVVMPIHESTAADPDKLLAAVRTLLKPPAQARRPMKAR